MRERIKWNSRQFHFCAPFSFAPSTIQWVFSSRLLFVQHRCFSSKITVPIPIRLSVQFTNRYSFNMSNRYVNANGFRNTRFFFAALHCCLSPSRRSKKHFLLPDRVSSLVRIQRNNETLIHCTINGYSFLSTFIHARKRGKCSYKTICKWM